MLCMLSFQLWLYCTLTDPKSSNIVRVLVRDPVKPSSARTGYINQGKPEYVPFTPYRPCTGPGRLLRGLLRAQNRRNLCMLNFQPRLYCALTDPKVFEKSCGPARHAHGFPRSWPFNCPGASCDIGINLVSYNVVTCALQVPTVFSFMPQDFKNPYVYHLEFHAVHMQVPCGPVWMPYKILIRSVVWAL